MTFITKGNELAPRFIIPDGSHLGLGYAYIFKASEHVVKGLFHYRFVAGQTSSPPPSQLHLPFSEYSRRYIVL